MVCGTMSNQRLRKINQAFDRPIEKKKTEEQSRQTGERRKGGKPKGPTGR